MTFPRIEYVEWLEDRIDDTTHDLATSDLHGRHDGHPSLESDGSADATTVRQQIATRYGVDTEQVLVTAGATAATFLAVATLLDTAEHLLVERPGYEPHVATPRGLGGRVDRFDRRPEDAYGLDLDEIDHRLQAQTGGILVTNRHNPSGRLLERSALAEAASLAGDHGARLLVDEVYAPYGSAGDGTGPFGSVTAAGLEHTVVTASLTKFHGYGGLRIGWLVADRDFVERARSIAVHLPTVATPSCRKAAAVLDAGETEVPAARELHDELAGLLTTFVEAHPSLSRVTAPECSFGFLAHERCSGDELAAAASEQGLLVVPGRFFGDEDRVRVSLGGTPETMTAALSALDTALERVEKRY
jgi:aspartate/methionine/tyrosine aminotransferase